MTTTLGNVTEFGEFLLLEQIAEGAQGDVWLARRRESAGAPVVIKRVHLDRAHDTRMQQRFLQEARIAAMIDHPNVAPVLDLGVHDGRMYLVMPYLDGLSLSRMIRRLRDVGERISVKSTVDVMCDALDGLGALHAMTDEDGRSIGFVHRDIAPKNLMFDARGRTTVIDLGIARSEIREWKTATGVLLGTPGYTAPEQVLASGVDQRTDLFAMGLVLFELLTFERYLPGDDLKSILEASLQDQKVWPGQYREDVPPELDALFLKSVALEPEHRFQSCAAFRDALRAVVPATDTRAPDLVKQIEWAEVLDRTTRYAAMAAAPTVPSDTVQTDAPSGSAPAPVLTVGLWRVVAVAAFLACVVAGFLLLDGPPSPKPQVLHVPEPRPTPTPIPRATPNSPPPPATPPRLVKKRVRAVEPPVVAAPREPPATKTPRTEPQRVPLEKLLTRTEALRRRVSNAEQRAELDGMLARINRLFVERTRGEQIDTHRVERDLRALEVALGQGTTDD